MTNASFSLRYYEKFEDDFEFTSSKAATTGGFNDHMDKGVRPSDKITKIYGCATMWHENKEEMIEMLKSVFRCVTAVVL